MRAPFMSGPLRCCPAPRHAGRDRSSRVLAFPPALHREWADFIGGRPHGVPAGPDVGGVMAEAVIEERQLLKSLHWYDGFVIALCNPGFLIGSLGFTLSTVGAWGSVVLWGISAVVGLLQN